MGKKKLNYSNNDDDKSEMSDDEREKINNFYSFLHFKRFDLTMPLRDIRLVEKGEEVSSSGKLMHYIYINRGVKQTDYTSKVDIELSYGNAEVRNNEYKLILMELAKVNKVNEI